uniref:Uncharacterized protein n=1 Tax=Oryza punctata TaxID=4537 RepID=A0A0E0JZ80_ORYPU
MTAEDAATGDEPSVGAWMTEERLPATSSIVAWTVEDAATGDELPRGTWTVGQPATILWCPPPDTSQVSHDTWYHLIPCKYRLIPCCMSGSQAPKNLWGQAKGRSEITHVCPLEIWNLDAASGVNSCPHSTRTASIQLPISMLVVYHAIPRAPGVTGTDEAMMLEPLEHNINSSTSCPAPTKN